ncbi:MAG: type VI secretion system baseplate subunit TssG [Phycisphaerae bacterium]
MAVENGNQASAVIGRLVESPYSFDFFQAIRRLECARPDRPRVGHSFRLKDDPLRLGQEPSLAFAPSTLSKCVPGSGGVPRLYVNFMGLLGPNGPMPLAVTEFVRDREHNHADPTIARFLDVFNHRMISFLYRAWACNQQAVNYERGQGDRYAVYIGSMFGIGLDSLRRRDAVPDAAKLHYSGRLVCAARHAEGLQAVLQDYFGIQTRIEQFIGQWLTLADDCVCRMGESPDTGALGRTAIVGARIWDCQQKFRIVLGPMPLADYERMLPGGASLGRLVAWVRNYIGDELSWDVQLILKKEEVPQTHLGKYGRLGWTTWMGSKPFDHDADDLKLRPFAN